jgi:predicted transcriptional regulator
MPTEIAALSFKQQAHALIDQLPDSATWDDVVYEMAVRRSIERGLADADAGRLTDVKDVRREFGLPE